MPELRKDPVIGRWVIIATERAKRPSDLVMEQSRSHGGFCPLCPGNEDKTPPEIFALRSTDSAPDSAGWRLRVVPNKFPALGGEGELNKRGEGMYDLMSGVGAHEVIVETPDHNATASTLSLETMQQVLMTYRERIQALKQDSRFRYISIFKNYGEVAGASLEHPHSQLIALPVVPKRAVEEIESSKAYYEYKERCVFCDIINQETDDGRRIVVENDAFIALEPFAPRFPFETWILPKKHISAFEDTEDSLFEPMADIFSLIFKKINAALEFPPYNYILHTAPINQNVSEHYHWHFEIMPRLTKVAGFEWGSGFYINPTPPEQAAAHLRETTVE
ncbi:MAG: galactose-1-phosphate uridylyltransferase [Deltaproteobacteria bacterium]|nr:galactose-1-phosphate uridylyltransferase [Deltaproteobacteria bacterium]